MGKKIGAVMIAAALTTGVAADTPGPSYSCTKAQTDTEKAICGSPYLSALDLAVAHAYTALLAAKPDQDSAIRSAQRDVISKRNACHADISCIAGILETRVDAMLTMTSVSGEPGKAGDYNAVPADSSASLKLAIADGTTTIDTSVVNSYNLHTCDINGPVMGAPDKGGFVFVDQNSQPIAGSPIITALDELLVLRGGSDFCGAGVSWPAIWSR